MGHLLNEDGFNSWNSRKKPWLEQSAVLTQEGGTEKKLFTVISLSEEVSEEQEAPEAMKRKMADTLQCC